MFQICKYPYIKYKDFFVEKSRELYGVYQTNV